MCWEVIRATANLAASLVLLMVSGSSRRGTDTGVDLLQTQCLFRRQEAYMGFVRIYRRGRPRYVRWLVDATVKMGHCI